MENNKNVRPLYVISFLHMYMYVYANMCTAAHMYKYTCPCMCAYGGQRSTSDTVLQELPTEVLMHGISLEAEVHWLTRQGEQEHWIYLLSPPRGCDYGHVPPCLAFLLGCWRLNAGPYVCVPSTPLTVPPPQSISPFIYTTLDAPCTLVERGRIMLGTSTAKLAIWRPLVEKSHPVLDFWSPVWCGESTGDYEQWQWYANLHKFPSLTKCLTQLLHCCFPLNPEQCPLAF